MNPDIPPKSRQNIQPSVSRNKREGYYAGHYPSHMHFGKGGHKRWDWFSMNEFYPRIWGVHLGW
jgi:hypothetical protein